jgi:type II secretory pathway pseudopilin PulG
VVIGILAALVIISYSGIQQAARDKAVLSDAETVAAEVTRYSTKNSGQYGSAVVWYSGGSPNSNINFTPSTGNLVDIVASSSEYCIRVYNPNSGEYKTLDTAFEKGSSNGACTSLGASDEAIAGAEPTYTYSNVTWTQRTSAGLRAWSGVASSSNGTNLAAAVNGGYIYTSTDSGATWTERTSAGSRAWHSIASSSNGTKLAAAVNGGYIYTSTDSGATWTERTSAGSRSWQGKIASSGDGSVLVAAPSFGYPYTSTDSGATWVERSTTGNNNWRDFSISSDGTRVVGVAMSNPVWVSTNSGVNWTSQTIGSVQWFAAVVSGGGSKMAIAPTGNQGPVYTSADIGVNWTSRPGSTSDCFLSLSSSVDGGHVAASTGTCGNGYIRLSNDSGVTWSQDQTMGRANWIDIASSSNGARLIIAADQRYTGSFVPNGYIYTGLYN